MTEFNAEEILKRLRGAASGAMAGPATPNAPTRTSNSSASRASVVAIPAPVATVASVRSSLAPWAPMTPQTTEKVAPTQPKAAAEPPPAAAPEGGASSPLYRKERLDVRDTLEQDNAHLREELKKAKSEIKALKQTNETISNNFRSYQAKKDDLLREKLGIIAELKNKIIALTGDRPPNYSNNKPLSQSTPSRQQSTSVSKLLDKSGTSKKQQRLSEEMRGKLEALSAAGNSAPFAKPTWSTVARHITPRDHDFARSFRGNDHNDHHHHAGGASPRPTPQSTGTGAGGGMGGGTTYVGGSPDFQNSYHSTMSFHTEGHAFNLSGSRGHFFKDRRPGEDDGSDEPAIVIDLSTR